VQVGIKIALKRVGPGAKLICHRVKKLVEWIPKGSKERYPYLTGEALHCERWQGRGRCLYYLDEVAEGEYVSCFINDGHSRWVVLLEPKEGFGDRLAAGGFEMSTYNANIIADNVTLEEAEDELRRIGERLGYSFLKDPRNLMAIYALREGIVKQAETCVEEEPEKCKIW